MSVIPEKRLDLDFDFSNAPTVYDFIEDDSFVTGIMGPVGSGKSYGSAAKLMIRALEQKPSPKDNVRYSRWAVVRNTYGELKTTTLKTWTELFPEHQWGRLLWTPPITHHIRMPKRGKIPGLDAEFMFLALDQPKDVRKLLSLNITGYWANEARELGFSIITHLNRRCGRYPSKDHGGPTWRGGILDTNATDEDHWWYRIAEKERPVGRFKWKFYRQPPAAFELAGEPTAEEADSCIFAAGRWWRFNPEAENLAHLPEGYYEQQMAGVKLDEIRCYVAAQYVFVADGKPFWPEFDQEAMVGEPRFAKGVPLQVGLDFGLTLNPAAAFGQRMPDGHWNILHEIALDEMGLERFGQRLLSDMQLHFPNEKVIAWGDPSAESRDPVYERVCADYLRGLGLNLRPCETNDVDARRDAGAGPMLRRNGLTIHRTGCKNMVKALAGGYHFKRVRVGGKDFFRDKPNKNMLSNIGDAYGYLMLGGGEYRKLTRSAPLNAAFAGGSFAAKTDFDVFAA